jgi:hypothetical protein
MWVLEEWLFPVTLGVTLSSNLRDLREKTEAMTASGQQVDLTIMIRWCGVMR